MAWTADDLIADVRRSAMLGSTTAGGVGDPDILAQADKELQMRLLPLLLSVREEFYVFITDFVTAAGLDKYRIPGRCAGGRTRDVLWLPSGTASGASVSNLPRIEPEDVWKIATNKLQGTPVGFYVESSGIILVPAPANAIGVLRLKWFTRPGRLVSPTGSTTTLKITAIAVNTPIAGTTRITLGAHTILASQIVDLIRNSSPFEYGAMDLALTGVAATTIDVLASALPSDFGASYIGDWISLQDTSPVVQLPVELHGVLGQWTEARMLQSLGFLDEAQQALKVAKESEREAIRLLTPRTEGAQRKVKGNIFWRKGSD